MKFSRLIEWGGTKEDSDEPPLQDWVRELKDGQSKNIFLMDGKAGSTDKVIEEELKVRQTRNIFLMGGKAGSTDEVKEKETEAMKTRKRKLKLKTMEEIIDRFSF